MTKQKEVIVAYLQNMHKQFGWVEIPYNLGSQYKIEDLMELKEQGEINDFRKKYYDVLPFYQTTIEGFNAIIKNYTWEIKFGF